MTINKSQVQTLQYVGVYLPKPVLFNGQLYVAISRIKAKVLNLQQTGCASQYG